MNLKLSLHMKTSLKHHQNRKIFDITEKQIKKEPVRGDAEALFDSSSLLVHLDVTRSDYVELRTSVDLSSLSHRAIWTKQLLVNNGIINLFHCLWVVRVVTMGEQFMPNENKFSIIFEKRREHKKQENLNKFPIKT